MNDKYLGTTYGPGTGTLAVGLDVGIGHTMPSHPNKFNDLKQQAYDPFKTQVGGNHYARFAIQPVEYIEKNNLPFADGCVVKYITRWRFKNGIEDLRKAKHFIEMLIALEEQKKNANNE